MKAISVFRICHQGHFLPPDSATTECTLFRNGIWSLPGPVTTGSHTTIAKSGVIFFGLCPAPCPNRIDRRRNAPFSLVAWAHSSCTQEENAIHDPLFRSMDTPSKNGSYLVIAACILAVISLILGIIALRSISAMKSQMGDVGSFAARLDSIETSSRKASSDAEKAVSRIATISLDTQRAFDNVGQELATLRTSVNRMTIEMKSFHGDSPSGGSRTTSKPVAVTRSSTTPSAAPASPPSAPVGQLDADGAYTIQAGDTFARLSGRFGVSVQAIEAANPGVDPRRLRIGQKIFIPTDS